MRATLFWIVLIFLLSSNLLNCYIIMYGIVKLLALYCHNLLVWDFLTDPNECIYIKLKKRMVLLMSGISQPFQPCCLANVNYSCGNVDVHGKALYALCEDPGSTFFWDNSHPSQAGWELVTQHYTNISFLTDTNSSTQTNLSGSATSMASKLPCTTSIFTFLLPFLLSFGAFFNADDFPSLIWQISHL